MSDQQRLDGRQPAFHPMAIPAVALLLRQTQPVAQIAQHPQIVERVDVAGDRLGDGADPRPCRRAVGQQCRPGVGFLQIVQDGQGLGQHRAVIKRQGRNQVLRVEGAIGRQLLLAAAAGQMDGHRVVFQSLEPQGDADTEGCGRAEVRI